MFDVFYSGTKPGLFAHERKANSIQQACELSRTRFFWWVNHLTDYSEFDWLWEPVPWEAHQRHAWASQHQPDSGTYLVPQAGYTDTNYHSTPVVPRQGIDADCWQQPPGISDFDYSWHPNPMEPPLIYQFGTQWQKTGGPRYVVPGAENVKYMGFPRATKTSHDDCWEIPGDIDKSSFDWTWHPDATEQPYIYQFATQHQKTGGPRYVVPGAADVKYLAELKIRTVSKATAIIEIDHLDGSAGQIPNTARKVRYFDNYRDTLIRIAKSIGTDHEYVWVCSSICDYSNFDFSWHPEDWQATMLHVFASDGEKFGDTFFMHVPTFADAAERRALLEWYDVNFVPASVPRRLMPVMQHNFDSQAEAVKSLSFNGPLALFTNTDYVSGNFVTVPLWRQETKTVVPLSLGATSVVVPKAAVADIKNQLYDYSYIDKTRLMLRDEPLDIVFISNGEREADWLYTWLEGRIAGLEPNRLVRVDGVNGRVAAYQAAARASNTPWFFAVFAKLQIDFKFDWSWQPDRMQQAKHYIFHARNPVNDLVYGHQAMIAYNKKLVLENTGQGLDFTLDQPHEVVPILSGTANYHTSNWMCWRTAFREALKLRASLPDVENEYRLEQWLTKDNTEEGWSSKGAQDAVEYYNSVNGNFDELRKSYEWDWLASYAFMKHGLSPNQ